MNSKINQLDYDTLINLLSLFPNPITLNRTQIDDQNQEYDEIVYVNPAFTKSLGYEVEDIPTDRVWFKKAYPDESYEKFISQEWFNALNIARENKQDLLGIPARIMCGDGVEKWFQVTSHTDRFAIGEFHLIIFVEIDTPEETILKLQKTSQELITKNRLLTHKESVLKETQQVAQIGSWEIDLLSGAVSWSEEMYKIYGEDSEHVPNMDDFYSRLTESDATKVKSKIESAIRTGERQHVIIDITRKNLPNITVEIFGQAVYDQNHQPVKVIGSSMDVTSRVALQNQNDELATILKKTHQELYIVDLDTDNYVYANESASLCTGYTNEEILSLSVYDLNPLLTKDHVKQLKALAGTELDTISNVSMHKRKDGTTYPVYASLQRITYNNRKCYAIFDADISELKQAEMALKDQFNLLQNIIDSMPVRIFWKNLEGRYLGANKLFLDDAQITDSSQLIGKTDFEQTWAEKDAEAYRKDDMSVMTSEVPKLYFEESQTNKHGEKIILSTSKVPLKNLEGEVIGLLGTYEDITERKQIQETLIEQQNILHHQAHHDALTGLPNRLLIKDRLDHAIKYSKRHHLSFGLLFIDLDQFKQINDAMGHDIGDVVLTKIAKKLQNSIRDSDTLARLGGDEFTILVEEIESEEDLSLFAEKIIEVSKEAIEADGQVFYLSSSIGVSMYPKDAQTVDELLKCADSAMYKAKEQGRNNVQFYTEDMTQRAFEHVAMQASLRQAIQNDEFILYYQPQINAENHSITGLEALVRWQHPSLGLVAPNKFIPLAESTGMIVELDRQVMKMAMKQVVHWHSRGINPGTVWINLAAKQIQHPGFIEFVEGCLAETKCKPEWIALEVTESDIMTNLDDAKNVLVKVDKLGIRMAIDDFGTGYSSLAYLKRLPVSKLKIDQSFIRDLPEDEDDKAITKTIITMAENLGFDVIAEGVETIEQRDFLLKNHCYNIQGYFYSKPIPSDAVPEFITNF
ncbi:EAL domain-containing protein [Thiomicrorhabdus sp. Milos-T2]|uniref:EAL domain-containing protein n=1 Tax=Thiomicrorhabdus sp. Milos-T2 TaxID=90814 RepID=UPI0009FCEE82|nr:EAL domain-containing protein [Thiomicrorhabdus sp. Milos-T2]